LLKDGYSVGRARADVKLDDPKVSGTHAVVRKNKQGDLMLIDQNSSNGIKVNGEKVRNLTLLPGVTFELGRSSFRVVEREGEIEDTMANTTSREEWVLTLKAELERVTGPRAPSPSSVRLFEPMVQLTFLQGIQADQTILLGYGPREFGADSLDVELEDETSPPVAFELSPLDGGVEFHTEFPDIVRLNDASIARQILHEGDAIQIGQTIIQVGFVP
jgi:pSer/pThr/pTyr-binding forkhead associated (FHA) protein